MKRTPLTEAQFGLLGKLDGWTIDEVPKEKWNFIPALERKADTFAVMASGCCQDPKVLNGINAIVGFDVLAHERNQKPKEPEGNAYHYVVQKISHPNYPYLLHGPFRSETLVEHWFDCPQLENYWKED
jgi:hypothetical protein